MGKTEKRYCDWNGEQLDGENYQLRLSDRSGAVVADVVVLELCGTCYSLFLKYLQDRQNLIAAAWVLNPAAIEKTDPK